jgi:hypothetical protein
MCESLIIAAAQGLKLLYTVPLTASSNTDNTLVLTSVLAVTSHKHCYLLQLQQSFI